MHLARHLAHKANVSSPVSPKLRILDLCTGTGCIPVLLHSLLAPHIANIHILGVEISDKAVALANQNLHWNIGQTHLSQIASEQVQFVRGDVFRDIAILQNSWDVIISNPPYISPRGFYTETSRSVRKYEPKSALVPPNDCVVSGEYASIPRQDVAIGDAFYPRLLQIAKQVNAKLLLMEVADMEQAKRAVALAMESGHWDRYEIWRDWPERNGTLEKETLKIQSRSVTVVGEGHGRAVVFSKVERGVDLMGQVSP